MSDGITIAKSSNTLPLTFLLFVLKYALQSVTGVRQTVSNRIAPVRFLRHGKQFFPRGIL